MHRDNDVVKALGFVALYAAYVEEGVDILMERLSRGLTDKKKKWPISRKIDSCIDAIDALESDELGQLLQLLNQTKGALEQRNEVIHGRIYAGNDRADNLKSGRPGVPDRKVTADELYDLAENLFSLQSAIPNINSFTTIRAIVGNNGT